MTALQPATKGSATLIANNALASIVHSEETTRGFVFVGEKRSNLDRFTLVFVFREGGAAYISEGDRQSMMNLAIALKRHS